jgi:hypothetical protein
LFLLSIHFTIVVFLAQTPTTLWEENDHLVHLDESVAHVPLLKRCFEVFPERKGQSTRASFVITIGV